MKNRCLETVKEWPTDNRTDRGHWLRVIAKVEFMNISEIFQMREKFREQSRRKTFEHKYWITNSGFSQFIYISGNL